ncbi:DUF4169 family protein [Sphingomonas sp. RT2P30]|uniref:DUF4169 family protein n=1 Tax=Parasphingomonas halimpatiens TaxID=3096162 RepID=UPI002FC88216
MGDVVNLRAARKLRKRAEASAQAEANRAKFGRTKAERLGDTTELARREKLLDDVRLTSDDA